MSKKRNMNSGCIENAYFEISGVKESGAFDAAMGGKGRL